MTPSTASAIDMNASSAKKLFDAETFKPSEGYHVCQTTAEFNADLEKLRQFDRSGEKKSGFFNGLMLLGGVALLVAIVCTFMDALGSAKLFAFLGGPTFVVGLIGWSAIGYADLENRRYEFLVQLVRLLGADMPANGLLNAKMDLLPATHGTKFAKKGMVGEWKTKFYVDRWLELSGVFLDGSKFSVSMVEKHQDRSKTKRSRSGKYKTKYKKKNSSEAIVRLKLKAKNHPDTSPYLAEITKHLRLPDWTILKSIDVQDHTITLRATTAVDWDVRRQSGKSVNFDGVEWVAMMFLSLYKALNQALNQEGKS